MNNSKMITSASKIVKSTNLVTWNGIVPMIDKASLMESLPQFSSAHVPSHLTLYSDFKILTPRARKLGDKIKINEKRGSL